MAPYLKRKPILKKRLLEPQVSFAHEDSSTDVDIEMVEYVPAKIDRAQRKTRQPIEPSASSSSSSSSSENDEAEFVVERILKKQVVKDETKYLIKWKGYTHDENTWEPEKNLTNCDRILQEFERRIARLGNRRRTNRERTNRCRTNRERTNRNGGSNRQS